MPNFNVNVVLDHKIRVRHADLPDEARRAIVDALTIPNRERENAIKQKQWGAERLPKTLSLWADDGEHLVMPRGFAAALGAGLRAFNLDPMWNDNRTWEPLDHLKRSLKYDLSPKRWQEPQLDSIFFQQQGIIKSPAGSGKTASVLLALRDRPMKSVIIVNTKDILWQWQERALDFLGVEAGQIGDNTFEVSDFLTIATAQTLNSRYDDLEQQGFFDEFSFVCLDECHHATAYTYNRVVDRFKARYRVGVSATPDKNQNVDFRVAECVLGPIIHTTKPDEVDILAKPEVLKVPTKFGFGFRPTKSRFSRSNYPQMIEALVRDPERNELIVSMIKRYEGHHQLVVSKRLEHLDIIEAMLIENFNDPIIKLTGKENSEERQQAKELAESSPCVLLSTLADEAMDIPRLDRIHLTFPQKNAGLVTQQVGRVERIHPDKNDSFVIDYCDLNVGPLEKQWRVRRFEVYEPRGYKITTVRLNS